MDEWGAFTDYMFYMNVVGYKLLMGDYADNYITVLYERSGI